MTLLEVVGVRYGKREHFWKKFAPILHDVSFDVREGEVFGFLGPNGAGKTTTIKTLLGLLRPDAGTIRLFGGSPGDPQTRTKLGFLPERTYFPEHLSASEVVIAHGLLSGLSRSDARARARELIERVGLASAASRPLRAYSKGMLQRVGIAQALVARPAMVIFDEPMSGLDPIGRADVRDIMLELRNMGTTVLFSTHILSDAETICDRVAILVAGRTRKVGKLSEITTDSDQPFEVVVRSLDDDTKQAIERAGGRVESRPNAAAIHSTSLESANLIIDVLRTKHVAVIAVHEQRGRLERLFLDEARSK